MIFTDGSSKSPSARPISDEEERDDDNDDEDEDDDDDNDNVGDEAGAAVEAAIVGTERHDADEDEDEDEATTTKLSTNRIKQESVDHSSSSEDVQSTDSTTIRWIRIISRRHFCHRQRVVAPMCC